MRWQAGELEPSGPNDLLYYCVRGTHFFTAPWSLQVARLLEPQTEWKIVFTPHHATVVGSDDGQPPFHICFDLAEVERAFKRYTSPNPPDGWPDDFSYGQEKESAMFLVHDNCRWAGQAVVKRLLNISPADQPDSASVPFVMVCDHSADYRSQ